MLSYGSFAVTCGEVTSKLFRRFPFGQAQGAFFRG